MNVGRISILLAAALLSTAAMAQDPPAGGKTRADVQDDLRKAQHDGVIPAREHDYPPKESTVARNKELHGISKHGGEKAPVMDNHDLGK